MPITATPRGRTTAARLSSTRRHHRRLAQPTPIHDQACRCLACSAEAREELRGDLMMLPLGLALGLLAGGAIWLGQSWPAILAFLAGGR